MRSNRRCALSSRTPTTPPRAAALPRLRHCSRRKKGRVVETLPSYCPAATSTAASSVVFSQRIESDCEYSVRRIDPYRPVTGDVTAQNSVAVDHAGIRRTVDHHSLESQRFPREIELQRTNDLVGFFRGSGNSEDRTLGDARSSARFIECQRIEEASLRAGVEREV